MTKSVSQGYKQITNNSKAATPSQQFSTSAEYSCTRWAEGSLLPSRWYSIDQSQQTVLSAYKSRAFRPTLVKKKKEFDQRFKYYLTTDHEYSHSRDSSRKYKLRNASRNCSSKYNRRGLLLTQRVDKEQNQQQHTIPLESKIIQIDKRGSVSKRDSDSKRQETIGCRREKLPCVGRKLTKQIDLQNKHQFQRLTQQSSKPIEKNSCQKQQQPKEFKFEPNIIKNDKIHKQLMRQSNKVLINENMHTTKNIAQEVTFRQQNNKSLKIQNSDKKEQKVKTNKKMTQLQKGSQKVSNAKKHVQQALEQVYPIQDQNQILQPLSNKQSKDPNKLLLKELKKQSKQKTQSGLKIQTSQFKIALPLPMNNNHKQHQLIKSSGRQQKQIKQKKKSSSKPKSKQKQKNKPQQRKQKREQLQQQFYKGYQQKGEQKINRKQISHPVQIKKLLVQRQPQTRNEMTDERKSRKKKSKKVIIQVKQSVGINQRDKYTPTQLSNEIQSIRQTYQKDSIKRQQAHSRNKLKSNTNISNTANSKSKELETVLTTKNNFEQLTLRPAGSRAELNDQLRTSKKQASFSSKLITKTLRSSKKDLTKRSNKGFDSQKKESRGKQQQQINQVVSLNRAQSMERQNKGGASAVQLRGKKMKKRTKKKTIQQSREESKLTMVDFAVNTVDLLHQQRAESRHQFNNQFELKQTEQLDLQPHSQAANNQVCLPKQLILVEQEKQPQLGLNIEEIPLKVEPEQQFKITQYFPNKMEEIVEQKEEVNESESRDPAVAQAEAQAKAKSSADKTIQCDPSRFPTLSRQEYRLQCEEVEFRSSKPQIIHRSDASIQAEQLLCQQNISALAGKVKLPEEQCFTLSFSKAKQSEEKAEPKMANRAEIVKWLKTASEQDLSLFKQFTERFKHHVFKDLEFSFESNKRFWELSSPGQMQFHKSTTDIDFPFLSDQLRLAVYLLVSQMTWSGLQALIQNYGSYNYQGFYVVWLFHNGAFAPVLIDDRLPCINQALACAFDQNWLALVIVEKAMAKLVGGYEALGDLSFRECFQILSGSSFADYSSKLKDKKQTNRLFSRIVNGLHPFERVVCLKMVGQRLQLFTVIQAKQYVNPQKRIQRLLYLQADDMSTFWIKYDTLLDQLRELFVFQLPINCFQYWRQNTARGEFKPLIVQISCKEECRAILRAYSQAEEVEQKFMVIDDGNEKSMQYEINEKEGAAEKTSMLLYQSTSRKKYHFIGRTKGDPSRSSLFFVTELKPADYLVVIEGLDSQAGSKAVVNVSSTARLKVAFDGFATHQQSQYQTENASYIRMEDEERRSVKSVLLEKQGKQRRADRQPRAEKSRVMSSSSKRLYSQLEKRRFLEDESLTDRQSYQVK